MRLCLLFIVLLALPVQAQIFTGYSYSPRLEKNVSGHEYKLESRNSFYLGYQKDLFKTQLQYSNYEFSTENGISSIETKSHEILAWGKYQLPTNPLSAIYYVGFGLGITWDEITTTLGNQSIEDKSDREIVLAAIVEGVKYIFPYLSVGADVKLIHSQYYSQRPTLELGLLNLTYYF